MPTDKEPKCIYECNKGIKCECNDCNICIHKPNKKGSREICLEN